MARRVITAETKAAILALVHAQGPKHYDAIAKQHGVSVPTIYNWLRALNAPAAETQTEVVA
jgi:transposase-like protein